MTVRTLAPQYDQGYIYTYSDLDAGSQNRIDLSDISGRQAVIGAQIINKGLLSTPLVNMSTRGINILLKSTMVQKAREQAVYDALGVSGDNVKELSDALREALFGELAEEVDYKDGQGPTRRMDKVFSFLRDYLKEVLYKDAKKIENAFGKGTTSDAFIEKAYNEISDPNAYLTSSLNESSKNGFLITGLKNLENIYKKRNKNEREILSLYNNLQKDPPTSDAILEILEKAKRQENKVSSSSPLGKNTSLTPAEMEKIVEKYSKTANRAATGDIGEMAFSSFVESNIGEIERGVRKIFEVRVTPTSNWAGDIGRKYQSSYANSLLSFLDSHYDNHPLLRDFVVANSKTKTHSILPKEDVVIDVWLNENKIADLLLPIGVSIKTSFHETNRYKKVDPYDDITIQSSSFRSFLQNLFYVPSNCLGDASLFYQDLLKIAMNLAGEVGWSNPNYKFQTIMSKTINYFAYVWLTGVVTERGTHSDFFFAYKNRKTYLIPMSAILEKVAAMRFSNPLIKEDETHSLWQQFSFTDEQLAALDSSKRRSGGSNKLLEMQNYALGPHGISKLGSIKLSNFPNLVQGMGL